MPNFDNLDKMYSYIQKKIEQTLIADVAKKVKEVEAKNIEDMVYSFPTSGIYSRRGHNGGLSDPSNIKTELTGPGELSITNETEVNPLTKPGGGYYNNAFPSGYNLAEIIEYGSNRLIKNPAKPFTQNTSNELEATGTHIEAL